MGALSWLMAGDDPRAADFINGVIQPAHLWFLWYIILFFMIAPMLLRSRRVQVLILLGTGIFSLTLPRLDPSTFITMLHFYVAGTLLPRDIVKRVRAFAVHPTSWMLAIALALGCATAQWGQPFEWATPWYTIQAYAFVPSLMMLCAKIDSPHFTATIKPISSYSLEVYVLHYPVVIVISRIIEPLRLDFVSAVVVITTLLIASLVLWLRVCRRYGGWLFEPPALVWHSVSKRWS
jgi:hypothetical protein